MIARVVETFQWLATKYDRPCSLTLAKLEACGVVRGAHSSKLFSFSETAVHFRGLLSTTKIAVSTLLIWLSWTLIGLAYPLFYVFLSTYLASRGADLDTDPFTTWRDYALTNIFSIFGPMLAAYLRNLAFLSRRYTMVVGALVTSAFFFAYNREPRMWASAAPSASASTSTTAPSTPTPPRCCPARTGRQVTASRSRATASWAS
jgi:hypothetical protein